jgi:hypothetical protein
MDTLLKKHIKKHMHKILDLFSGLGGFSLGLERTGCFKTKEDTMNKWKEKLSVWSLYYREYIIGFVAGFIIGALIF